jgi:hypothetical protein
VPRALDRGLTGVLASLLRLGGPEWNANAGAADVDPAAARTEGVKQAIRRRADRQLSGSGAAELAQRLDVLLDAWRAEAAVGQRTLVYQARGKSDTDVSLLHEPGIEGWSEWTVPTSMRNVELAVPLKLRPAAISAPREAWDPPQRSAPLPDLGAAQ